MIRSLLEKKGGTRALNKDSSAFQCFSENMKLIDIETNNGLCTWNNKRGGDFQVASKLDRFMIPEELMLLDKEIIADILPYGGSDHWPIQMEIKGIGTPRNKPFRFENIWLSHPYFISNIGNWWAKNLQIQGSSMFILHKRLKHIKQKLKEWNQKEFAHNRISSIKDENGRTLQTHEEIDAVLVKHFRDISKENFSEREPFIKNLTEHIPKLVSKEDNCNLNSPVTEQEISEVLKEMQNGKAPGPDGFNVDFFKSCWNIVKRDIVDIVKDSRRNKTILKALNTSFIALIPK
eukprot:PITA_27848